MDIVPRSRRSLRGGFEILKRFRRIGISLDVGAVVMDPCGDLHHIQQHADRAAGDVFAGDDRSALPGSEIPNGMVLSDLLGVTFPTLIGVDKIGWSVRAGAQKRRKCLASMCFFVMRWAGMAGFPGKLKIAVSLVRCRPRHHFDALGQHHQGCRWRRSEPVGSTIDPASRALASPSDFQARWTVSVRVTGPSLVGGDVGRSGPAAATAALFLVISPKAPRQGQAQRAPSASFLLLRAHRL